MRFWAFGLLSLLLLGGARDASAAFIFVAPSATTQPVTDFSPVTYEVFLGAGGWTGGIGLADVTLTFSNLSMIGSVTPSANGNPFAANGASMISATDVLFTGSDIVTLFPTPTGSEIIKMGEFDLVHSGIVGVINIQLNSTLTQVYDTLAFTTTLPITNLPFGSLATLDVIQPVPEPGTIGLLGIGCVGLAALRRRAARAPLA